jgi:hypothetical protein
VSIDDVARPVADGRFDGRASSHETTSERLARSEVGLDEPDRISPKVGQIE